MNENVKLNGKALFEAIIISIFLVTPNLVNVVIRVFFGEMTVIENLDIFIILNVAAFCFIVLILKRLDFFIQYLKKATAMMILFSIYLIASLLHEFSLSGIYIEFFADFPSVNLYFASSFLINTMKCLIYIALLYKLLKHRLT